MDAVVIWGATPLSQYLANNMKHNHTKVEPVAYIDNNLQLYNTSLDGIPIVSYDELLKREGLKEITILLGLKSPKSILQVIEQLKDFSSANVGVVKARAQLLNIPVDPWELEGEIVWNRYNGSSYRIIPRIEINLIDACNLKCKGCTHFASLYGKESVYSLIDYKNDLLQLRSVGKIVRIRLLGGEPFLMDNLDEYIMCTRKIFPETDIEVVTNGLLIPKINTKIIESMKLNNVNVTISSYKPTLEKKDQILKRLDEYKIPWKFEVEKIVHFTRSLTLQNTHNARLASKICKSAICTFLRKGRLYKCPFDAMINDFYKHYGIERYHESGISIYQDKENVYEKLKKYIFEPVEMCKYCSEIPEIISWSIEANPSLEDWLYKNGKCK